MRLKVILSGIMAMAALRAPGGREKCRPSNRHARALSNASSAVSGLSRSLGSKGDAAGRWRP